MKKNSKTFYFESDDPDGRVTWWDEIRPFEGEYFFDTFTRDQLGYNTNYYVKHNVNHPGWEWLVDGKLANQQGQGVEFIIDLGVYDSYPDETHFVYGLVEGNSGETEPNTYTITVKADKWERGKWTGNSRLSKAGFSENTTNYEETITVKAGDSVTIYTYGDWGTDSDVDWWYEVAGFYNVNHVAYKTGKPNNNGIDTYTFTVSCDMTIYVDFQFRSR